MFRVHKRDIHDVEPIEYRGGTLLSTGMAVTVNTSDNYVKATGAGVPTHIIVGEKSNGVWGAIRIQPTTVYETTSTVAVATPGLAVQINSNGLDVNATTGGAFLVEYTENKTNGVVRGRFKKEV